MCLLNRYSGCNPRNRPSLRQRNLINQRSPQSSPRNPFSRRRNLLWSSLRNQFNPQLLFSLLQSSSRNPLKPRGLNPRSLRSSLRNRSNPRLLFSLLSRLRKAQRLCGLPLLRSHRVLLSTDLRFHPRRARHSRLRLRSR